MARARRSTAGGAYVIALISLVVALALALALVRMATGAARAASRLDRRAAARCLADGGVDYGLWLYRQAGAELPIRVERALGNGTISVRVEDYSHRAPDTILVRCEGRADDATYEATLVAPAAGEGGAS